MSEPIKKSAKNRLRSLCPPPLVSVFAAIVFAALSLLPMTTDLFLELPEFVCYIVYACAAFFGSLAVWEIVLSCKRSTPKQKILALAEKNAFTAKLAQDYAYRTIACAYISLIFNALMTVSKMLTGWYSSSTWLMVLSGYYIILCLSKFLLIRSGRKQEKQTAQTSVMRREWKAHRLCGIMLLVMTLFLQGVIIMIIKNGMGFVYHEIVVIAIAAYDFYCLVNATVYMVAKRKNRSPLVNAIKSISFASSLVAILSLQTAMFASFGAAGDAAFRKLMNFLTGTAVCVLMIALGVFMIIRANKELKSMRAEELT